MNCNGVGPQRCSGCSDPRSWPPDQRRDFLVPPAPCLTARNRYLSGAVIARLCAAEGAGVWPSGCECQSAVLGGLLRLSAGVCCDGSARLRAEECGSQRLRAGEGEGVRLSAEDRGRERLWAAHG
jgi:hypothetical protein